MITVASAATDAAGSVEITYFAAESFEAAGAAFLVVTVVVTAVADSVKGPADILLLAGPVVPGLELAAAKKTQLVNLEILGAG